MCIIAAKSAGVALPSDETMEIMFSNNDDGAGFMYWDAKHSIVVIKKGFMDFDSFLTAIHEIKNPTATPIVMHFRIATHGGVNAACCHPFPVTDNEGLLRKPESRCKIGVAHNGIISSVDPNKDESDTMCYIREQLAPLSKALPKFYENKYALELINNAIGSKMAFLADGKITLVGKFEENKGIHYSNSTFKYMTWRYGLYSEKYDGTLTKWDYDEYSDYAQIKACNFPIKDGFVMDKDGYVADDIGDVFVDKEQTLYYYSYEDDALVPLSYDHLDFFGVRPRFNADEADIYWAICKDSVAEDINTLEKDDPFIAELESYGISHEDAVKYAKEANLEEKKFTNKNNPVGTYPASEDKSKEAATTTAITTITDKSGK